MREAMSRATFNVFRLREQPASDVDDVLAVGFDDESVLAIARSNREVMTVIYVGPTSGPG